MWIKPCILSWVIAHNGQGNYKIDGECGVKWQEKRNCNQDKINLFSTFLRVGSLDLGSEISPLLDGAF